MKTAAISVSLTPMSSSDTSGGRVSVRIAIRDELGHVRTKADLLTAAVGRACERLYGQNAFWWNNSGLPGYGQIMRSCKTGGSNAVTYHTGLTSEITKLPADYAALLSAQQAGDSDVYALLDKERLERGAENQ